LIENSRVLAFSKSSQLAVGELLIHRRCIGRRAGRGKSAEDLRNQRGLGLCLIEPDLADLSGDVPKILLRFGQSFQLLFGRFRELFLRILRVRRIAGR
jgi:hypothetical protein